MNENSDAPVTKEGEDSLQPLVILNTSLEFMNEYISYARHFWETSDFQIRLLVVLVAWVVVNILLINIAWKTYGELITQSMKPGEHELPLILHHKKMKSFVSLPGQVVLKSSSPQVKNSSGYLVLIEHSSSSSIQFK